MGAYYDEIEIEDMVWDDEKRVYHYPCPCGDRFEISKRQLADCEDIATCPSCSLIIRVIYDPVRFCFVFLCSPISHYYFCSYWDLIQLDFEDEPPDDDDSGVEEAEEEDSEEDDSAEEDHDDSFQDALESLTLDETPKTIAVSA